MTGQVRHLGTSDAAKRLFLFGSALYSENPRDIDILVVYATSLSPVDALDFRSKLISKLRKYIAIPIHVVLLSQSEERKLEFGKIENCRPLRRHDVRRWLNLARK
jgi:predicted nucleotidyltransferase